MFAQAFNLLFGATKIKVDEEEVLYNPMVELTYSIIVPITLMNLVIAILSDAYELVASEIKFFDDTLSLASLAHINCKIQHLK